MVVRKKVYRSVWELRSSWKARVDFREFKGGRLRLCKMMNYSHMLQWMKICSSIMSPRSQWASKDHMSVSKIALTCTHNPFAHPKVKNGSPASKEEVTCLKTPP